MTTLEKVLLFERYLKLTHGHVDRTLDTVLDKLLERKRMELTQQCEEMRVELEVFEKQYGMASAEFFDKFERGELGDTVDFFDWSATWQMYTHARGYLQVLLTEPVTV
jgi:hypothetical protein